MNNRKSKPKGQSRMANPEKLPTLGTQDRRRRHTQQSTAQKTKEMSNMNPTKNRGEPIE